MSYWIKYKHALNTRNYKPMEPLHTFTEYWAAIQTMNQLQSRRELIGLSEKDELEYQELLARITNYQEKK